MRVRDVFGALGDEADVGVQLGIVLFGDLRGVAADHVGGDADGFFQAVVVLEVDQHGFEAGALYLLLHGGLGKQDDIGAGGKQGFALHGGAVGERGHFLMRG